MRMRCMNIFSICTISLPAFSEVLLLLPLDSLRSQFVPNFVRINEQRFCIHLTRASDFIFDEFHPLNHSFLH